MKQLFFFLILTIIIAVTPSVVFAQGMMGGWTSSPSGTGSDNHTAREEAEGKEIWEKLQAKQLECNNLTDDNFESLGEYFMGKMIGFSHEAMNTMMEKMMGKEGEEQMHIVMGKRMSGCNTSTSYPTSGFGFIPMMGMTRGGGNPMMGGWGGFGLGWISMILFWGLLILAIIALLKWLLPGNKGQLSKTPLEVLRERFAKGEIDKKEYEEKVKILTRHEGSGAQR